ncbi:inositol-phosphate phosphatase [archaeon]|nr:inositol-phosphate phosphatase [archaeon]
MEQSKFMQVALEVAKKAEKVIMNYYSDSIRAELKSDQSPVTIADTEAERIIKEIISKAFPEHGFVGEEFGKEKENAEYKWIIDPIDGTKNYVRKIPLFATEIALMKGDELILGVSNAPAMKELLYAEKGKGAYFNGKRINVSKNNSLNKSYLSFGGLNLFEKHGMTRQLVGIVNKFVGRRGFGDFWSYHLLAKGSIDCMVEPDTKIWDIAAVKVIVEEAGGRVTDIKGGPVTLNTTSIIATNGLIHDKVAEYFK